MKLYFTLRSGTVETVTLNHADRPMAKQPRLGSDGKVRWYKLTKVLPCMTSAPSVMEVYYEETDSPKLPPQR